MAARVLFPMSDYGHDPTGNYSHSENIMNALTRPCIL